MDTTNNLKLPYIMSAQAQKHVTHNEALRLLDSIIQLAVETATLDTPPSHPTEGARYIVAASAQAAWTGHEDEIAAWQDGAWIFHQPENGWRAYVRDTGKIYIFDEDVWTAAQSDLKSLQNAEFVGVGTTADETNPLSVSSDAVLFSHAGSDQRTKINKASESDTASLVFQTNFSGRAEMGLTGGDDFSFKVSQDGTEFHDAIKLNRTNGEARFPANSMTEHLLFNLFSDGGRFAGSPEASGVPAGAFSPPNYLNPYNGATFSGAGEFIHNNSTHGGSAAALSADVDDFITKLKTTEAARRSGPEFHLMRVSGGAGTAAPYTIDGTTRYLAFTNPAKVLMVNSTWGINIKVETKSVAVTVSFKNELYVDGVFQGSDLIIEPGDGWKQLVFVGIRDPRQSPDYDTALFRIYAEAETDMLLALPFLTPAQIRPKPGELLGRAPTPSVWS